MNDNDKEACAWAALVALVLMGGGLAADGRQALRWADRHSMPLAVALLTAACVLFVCRRVIGLARRKGRIEKKLAEYLAPRVGYTGKTEPKRNWLTVPRRPRVIGAEVKILYARTWMPSSKDDDNIAATLATLYGGEWAPKHHHSRDTMRFVRVLPVPVWELPDRADYDPRLSYRPHLIPFAVDDHREPVMIDLTEVAHHVLVSAATGNGKTTIIALFAAHVAGHGGLVTICDPKRIGYTAPAPRYDLRGLPAIELHTTVQAMTAAIAEVKNDMDWRYEQGETADADLTDRERFPLRLLVMDEMGSLVAMLKQEWKNTRSATDPATPPTLDAIMAILWQGRAAGIHVLCAAQQANAAVLINSDARDQYGLKIAAGHQSQGAWEMMFGRAPQIEVEPVKGRAVAGIGTRRRDVQLAHITPEQARTVAAHGRNSHTKWAAERAAGNPPVIPPDAGNSRPVSPVSDGFWDLLDPETDPHDELPVDYRHVPDDAPTKPARRRGRPPGQARPPVAVTCTGGHDFTSSARPGQWVKCRERGCSRTGRVPLGS